MTTNQLHIKQNEWLTKLAEIEQKHIEWFKKRPSIFDQDEHDSIANHLFTDATDGHISFTFWKYSELPEPIKTECLTAYHELFSSEAAA
jgi:hypothetical protein